jgi:hypothetical protein
MSGVKSALVVDDAKGGLGQVALRLIRLGIDSYYAKDVVEAWLLAQQEADRIRVLLIAPGADRGGIARILALLRGHAPPVPRSVVAIGSCPDEASRAELREIGVEWALWEPWDESALRMVLANAMAPPLEGETRRAERLPTTLLGRAFKGLHRRDGVVCSLSTDGAFLEMPHPYEEGTRITLEIDVEGVSLVTKAEVRYTLERGGAGASERPAGMGLAFREIAPEARDRLTRFLAEQHRRFGV